MVDPSRAGRGDQFPQPAASKGTTLQGRIEAIGIHELLRLSAIRGSTGLLLVYDDHSDSQLYYDEGRLVAAMSGSVVGAECLGPVLAMVVGDFEFTDGLLIDSSHHMPGLHEAMLSATKVYFEREIRNRRNANAQNAGTDEGRQMSGVHKVASRAADVGSEPPQGPQSAPAPAGSSTPSTPAVGAQSSPAQAMPTSAQSSPAQAMPASAQSSPAQAAPSPSSPHLVTSASQSVVAPPSRPSQPQPTAAHPIAQSAANAQSPASVGKLAATPANSGRVANSIGAAPRPIGSPVQAVPRAFSAVLSTMATQEGRKPLKPTPQPQREPAPGELGFATFDRNGHVSQRLGSFSPQDAIFSTLAVKLAQNLGALLVSAGELRRLDIQSTEDKILTCGIVPDGLMAFHVTADCNLETVWEHAKK